MQRDRLVLMLEMFIVGENTEVRRLDRIQRGTPRKGEGVAGFFWVLLSEDTVAAGR